MKKYRNVDHVKNLVQILKDYKYKNYLNKEVIGDYIILLQMIKQNQIKYLDPT